MTDLDDSGTRLLRESGVVTTAGRHRAGPLVSVVLPTHLGGPLFEEALSSALGQTWSRLEVLIVDNRAGLDRAALERRDPRVAVLVEETPGISVARTRSLSVAHGDYVAFLDHDDLWRPEKLERQRAALAADPRAACSHSGGIVVDQDGREIGVHPSRRLSGPSLRRFRVDDIFSSVMVRRDAAIVTGGFRPEFRDAQDIDDILRLLETGPASFFKEPLVSYRWHSGSTSQPLVRRRAAARECLRIAAWQRALARVRRDPASYVDAWVGTVVVRTNAARDALSLCGDRSAHHDWVGAGRALGSAIGLNPAVPAVVGLKALGRRIEGASIRRSLGQRGVRQGQAGQRKPRRARSDIAPPPLELGSWSRASVAAEAASERGRRASEVGDQ